MTLAKSYSPSEFESTIYKMWETSKVFNPGSGGDPYSIVMPPANANGNLHIGHALTIGLEDILARYYRLQGRDVIYIPGEDHAGLETWVVYERELEKQGKSRFDYSREENYQGVKEFVDMHRGNTEKQVRALGASVSWPNLTYTLDEKVVKRAYATFKKMWDDDLLYRGERIVNYSTKYQTGYADIEVSYKNEKGSLWKIGYPVLDHVAEIVVATTRPETMLGDTAIAVHPDDERYKGYIGSHVMIPIINREIPVIADEHVDPTYGTGAVKVTPAHDPNDFEIGNRHDLERIQVIDYDGRMINVPKRYEGLTVAEARNKIIDELTSSEFMRGIDKIEHSVGYDYKSGLPIQPLIKEQWFIKMEPLAKRAIEAIKNDEIKFYPASKKAALINYLENLHDWNISRQIPWGIPIPAFQNTAKPDDWIFDERVGEQEIVVNGTTYRREEDTFDTWFSSGQWPYVTTDYLDGGELAKYYPLNVMETGYDILFPWVSRMIMFGLYATDKIPFKEVYLHGLVLDEHGQKMSKSKGNVVNPMDMIEKYGSDALRLGLITSRSAGQNQAFGESRVITGRNFCNKLWNIARYIEGALPEGFTPSDPEPDSLVDHWIISRLAAAREELSAQIEDYRFAEASETIYHTVWDDVADWFIESNKKQPNDQLLAWVLDTVLRLAHPFAPFVTEAIWQTLGWTNGLLAEKAWPGVPSYNPDKAVVYNQLQKLVTEARYVISELPNSQKYTMLYHGSPVIEQNAELIAWLARLEAVQAVDEARGLRLATNQLTAWIDLDDDTLYEHQSKLELRLATVRSELKALTSRLDNPNYVAKAPEHLVAETREQIKTKQELINKLERELNVID